VSKTVWDLEKDAERAGIVAEFEFSKIGESYRWDSPNVDLPRECTQKIKFYFKSWDVWDNPRRRNPEPFLHKDPTLKNEASTDIYIIFWSLPFDNEFS